MYRGKKKFYRRKKKVYRRRSTWGNLAKKALKTANFVAKLVNAEYKYFDINTIGTVTDYNGNVSVNLCTPPQGTTANEREGDSIKLKNLTFRGQFARNTRDEIVRLIIFIDKENEVVNGSDLMEIVGNSNVVFSPKNNALKYDTKILKDVSFRITGDNPIIKFDWVQKINLHEHFITSTTNASNNAIKYAVFGQYATGGSYFSVYSRMTYLDN